jgi:hypothetical protein
MNATRIHPQRYQVVAARVSGRLGCGDLVVCKRGTRTGPRRAQLEVDAQGRLCAGARLESCHAKRNFDTSKRLGRENLYYSTDPQVFRKDFALARHQA